MTSAPHLGGPGGGACENRFTISRRNETGGRAPQPDEGDGFEKTKREGTGGGRANNGQSRTIKVREDIRAGKVPRTRIAEKLSNRSGKKEPD